MSGLNLYREHGAQNFEFPDRQKNSIFDFEVYAIDNGTTPNGPIPNGG